jgi:hypothetical protein
VPKPFGQSKRSGKGSGADLKGACCQCALTGHRSSKSPSRLANAVEHNSDEVDVGGVLLIDNFAYEKMLNREEVEQAIMPIARVSRESVACRLLVVYKHVSFVLEKHASLAHCRNHAPPKVTFGVLE